MKVIEYACAYGVDLVEARKLTDEEKTRYLAEYRDSMLIGTGANIHLEHISWQDLDAFVGRRTYSFPGCGNRAYEISDAEWDALLALDQERAAAVRSEKARKYVANLRDIIATAEAQRDIPTNEEAARRIKAYNNANNEGGYGYVPYIVTAEQYEAAKAALATAEAQHG